MQKAQAVREKRHAMAATPAPDAVQLISGVVGQEVAPYVGMRVRHAHGVDHQASRGLLGTIELIPGRSYESYYVKIYFDFANSSHCYILHLISYNHQGFNGCI